MRGMLDEIVSNMEKIYKNFIFWQNYERDKGNYNVYETKELRKSICGWPHVFLIP